MVSERCDGLRGPRQPRRHTIASHDDSRIHPAPSLVVFRGWSYWLAPVCSLHDFGAAGSARNVFQGTPVVPLVGFALFGGAILVLQWIVKCPKCKARLAQTIAMQVAFSGWRSGPKVCFCPFCGVNLDQPVPGSNIATQSQNPQNPIFPA